VRPGDVDAAKARGLVVTNTRGVLTDCTAGACGCREAISSHDPASGTPWHETMMRMAI